VVEVAVVRLDAGFVFAMEWGMGDYVWLIAWTVVVVEWCLRVVIVAVMVIGGIVACEGWVLLGWMLRTNVIVYWRVMVWGGSGAGMSLLCSW
jgi:hypothetical protein